MRSRSIQYTITYIKGISKPGSSRPELAYYLGLVDATHNQVARFAGSPVSELQDICEALNKISQLNTSAEFTALLEPPNLPTSKLLS
jgi:hypothetical protein